MPAMHYFLRWPDGSEMRCYSPSLVVRDFLEPGASYAVPDFIARMREATQIASDRVAHKYGFACSRAADQLALLEAQAAAAGDQARVDVLRFEGVA